MKRKRFDKAVEARRAARQHAPKAGATQRIPDKRAKLIARAEKKDSYAQ